MQIQIIDFTSLCPGQHFIPDQLSSRSHANITLEYNVLQIMAVNVEDNVDQSCICNRVTRETKMLLVLLNT